MSVEGLDGGLQVYEIEEAILSKLNEIPVSVVEEELENWSQLPKSPSGEVLPYIVVSFSSPWRDGSQGGLENVRKDVHKAFCDILCVANNARNARKLRSAVFAKVNGFIPTYGSQLVAEGGQTQRRPAIEVIPVRYVTAMTFSYYCNLEG